MKRLDVVLLFVLAILQSSSLSAQDERSINSGRPVPLDLQDCNITKIFAGVWEFTPLVQRENAAWIINSGGKYAAIDWLYSPQPRIAVWSAPLPDGIVAQAHTHGDHLDPKPSGPDIDVARRLNIFVYILTRKGIWRADPNGAVTLQESRGWYDRTMQKCGKGQARRNEAIPADLK